MEQYNNNNNPNIPAPNQSYDHVNKQCCCFNMRKVMRAVTQFYDRYLESSGIRSTQFTLLVELASTSAKTLTEIAENLVMDRTTLTRNLKPLAKMGLITIVSTMDKRSKAYALTDQGKELVAKCVPLWQSAQSSIIGGIGSADYQEIMLRLDRLLNTLSLHK
jgi:DNA-binding MarR family transcriptional regulator